MTTIYKLRIIPSSGSAAIETDATPETSVNELCKVIYAQSKDIVAGSVRLIYAGRELKPKSAKLFAFEIGKLGNYNIHMLCKKIQVIDTDIIPLPAVSQTTSVIKRPSTVVDLTGDEDDNPAVLASDSKSGTKRARTSSAKKETENRAARFRSSCPAGVEDRISRAISQRMYLVHQNDMSSPGSLCRKYAVLGSTGNVYDVTIGQNPNCTCPDCAKGNLCKHIIFVMIKVLRLRRSSGLIYQKALLQSELEEIFKSSHGPVAVQAKSEVIRQYKAVAGIIDTEEAKAENEAAQAAQTAREAARAQPEADEECPICFEEFHSTGAKQEPVESCAQCLKFIHKDCIQRWLVTDKSKTCPNCRSVWSAKSSSSSSSASSTGKAGGAGGGIGDGVKHKEGYINLGGLQGQSGSRDSSTYSSGWHGHGYGYGYGRGRGRGRGGLDSAAYVDGDDEDGDY